MTNTTPIIVIAGATASGKSAYAMQLAETRGGAIINADSMQLYRDIPTLTARPSVEDEARYPHYLYGILAPEEQYSAGKWLDAVSAAIQDCWDKNLQPIIVGGTGLYIKALLEGLAPIPDINPAIRAEGEALRAEMGFDAFYAYLVECDPLMANYAEAQNPARVLRAWEVWRQTGKSIKAWQQEEHRHPLGKIEIDVKVLQWGREALYARCDQRFHLMLEQGALEEVRDFLSSRRSRGGLEGGQSGRGWHNAPSEGSILQNPHPNPLPEGEGVKSLPISRVLGLLPLIQYLEGQITLDEAIETAQRDTRRYAKRQDTWFRNQLSSAEILSR